MATPTYEIVPMRQRAISQRSYHLFIFTLLFLASFVIFYSAAQAGSEENSYQNIFLTGVNLAGAEFGQVDGKHGHDYVYPTEFFVSGYKSPNYFLSKGMNTFRLPILWERIQPELQGPLDRAEQELLTQTIQHLGNLGAWIVIDLHNYGSYRGQSIGQGKVSPLDFADVWNRLSALFRDNNRVIFGLMNEPNGLQMSAWLDAANEAIVRIRGNGAKNLVLVSGNYWSGAHAWYDKSGGPSNAESLLHINDPLGRIAYEAHVYFDTNNSGTNPDCIDEKVGVERLAPFTRWLENNNRLGFIGEFGAGRSAKCLAALSAFVRELSGRPDVYLGWTYWAAGPWWPNDYFSSIEPNNGADSPQMLMLKPHLRPEAMPIRKRH